MSVRTLLAASAWMGLASILTSCGGDTANPGTGSESGGDDSSGGFSRGSGTGGAGGAAGNTSGSKKAGGSSGAAEGAAGSGAGKGGAAGTNSGGGGSGSSSSSTGGSAGSSGAKTSGGGGGAGPAAGAPGAGGNKQTGGSSGGAGSSAGSTGGAAGSSGAAASGGSVGTGGTTGCRADEKGKTLAKPGDQATNPSEYLNLGDMRVLNNRWGSDELNCNTPMKVYVKSDGTIGWDFNRGTCDTSGTSGKSSGKHPDYPEIEFGIHPFGIGSSLETSPPFPSTDLLPLQIKDITSASATIDNININLQNASSWNLNFEFWVSQRNPITESDPGVYAELITFWGWQNGRWPCDTTLTKTASSGGKTYKLCHQSDSWGSSGPTWRYYQFWVDGGPMTNFSGKIDVKAMLDWLVKEYNYSKDLWITRFEVGSEIDDNTSGTVTIKNITFEVNGASKSVELCKQ